MYPVNPDLVKGTEVTLATGMVVAVFKDADLPGSELVVSRWELTAEERNAVQHGQDLFLVQASSDRTVQPAFLVVGRTAFDRSFVTTQADGDAGPHNTVPTDSEGEEDPARSVIRETELI